MAVTVFFLAGCLLFASGEADKTAPPRAPKGAADRQEPEPTDAQPKREVGRQKWRSRDRSVGKETNGAPRGDFVPQRAPSTEIRAQDTPPEQSSGAEEEPRAAPKTLASEAEGDLKPLVPVRQRPRRRTAELILEEMLESPDAQPGDENHRPLSLLDALARTVDRTHRLRIAQTYWDVAVAQAEGRLHRRGSRFLDELEREIRAASPRPAGEAEMAALRASQSDARAREAEAKWTFREASDRLSELAALDPRAAPAVTSDRPHVGAYRTRFEEIFARRAAPPQARLLDRTLPLRHQEVDARAKAVVAAADALVAARDALFDGVVGLSEVLDLHAALVEQRRGFLSAVSRYNHEIAQYALIVVPDGMPAKTVVGMLIVPRDRGATAATGRSTDGWTGSSVQHAGYNQAPPPPEAAESPATETADESEDDHQPISVTADESRTTSGETEDDGVGSLSRGVKESDSAASSQPETSEPLDPTERSDISAGDETETEAALFAGSGGLYGGLVDADPQTRLDSLTEWLSFEDADDDMEAVTLQQCLGWANAATRRNVISSFWRAHRRAASYHCLAWRSDEYAKLASVLITLRSAPAAALAMLRLQAARAAADADVLAARAEWDVAGFELTQACGRSVEARWLQPASRPSVTTLSSTAGKRLAPLHSALLDRATGVVGSDAAYGQTADSLASDASTTGELIKCLERQTARTLDFLAAVETYNRLAGDALVGVN